MIKKIIHEENGQSLIEVLVGFAIGAILIGSSTYALLAILRASSHIESQDMSYALNTALMQEAKAFIASSWDSALSASYGSTNQYFITTSTEGGLGMNSGNRVQVMNKVSYTSYFYFDEVYQKDGEIVSSSTEGATLDRAVQQITVITSWAKQANVTSTIMSTDYVIRSQNAVFLQGDWSGGATEGKILEGNTYATSSNIDFSNNTIRLYGL